MTEADSAFMRAAIEAAQAMVGRTGGNPAVGCVIVRGGEIVAQAATGEGGRPHAEEQALTLAGESARGAAAYLTLEPCAERSGGGASCTERLERAGVARVVIACADPSVLAAGRGAERLSAAGVAVEAGVLESEAVHLYRDYTPRS
ncbi:MAG: bifunctional diaminohydroxyphosphoribosylaminopyrimidine deaminase/5-amino-6-(5-phosphoribosylamino)uracil reductase RibD [Caulobacteraceae bacterium]